MSRFDIDLIVGVRPNVMKVAPLYHALQAAGEFHVRLVHTGQHYDHNLSKTFFEDFGLPPPDVFLDVRSGSHAAQTARVIEAYDRLCLDELEPDLVVVVGDVNSTLACALTAKKRNLSVAHLEAGLRNGDRSMPEEINRIATDAIADHLWTPSADADANLRKEGHQDSRIHCVGNIMIDAYELVSPRIACANMPEKLRLTGDFILATFHRPANVDNPENLGRLVRELKQCARNLPVVFPVHPRTRGQLEKHGLWPLLASSGINAIDPLGYIAFMSLVRKCRLVLTDSGGVQEETSYLGIPCITIRDRTERPITVTMGTNELAPLKGFAERVEHRLIQSRPTRPTIPLWDGKTATRIVKLLQHELRS